MRGSTGFGWGALALVLAVATACEPSPPRLTLIVDTSGAAPDAAPGDGRCATATGACTLSAAIDEGNALGKAAISLPPGSYDLSGETVTGTIWINDREPDLGVRLTGRVAVASGGSLLIDGAVSNFSSAPVPPSGPLRFQVDGNLVLRDVQVGWASATETLVHVGSTGIALIDTSFLGTSFAAESVVVNEGRLWLRHAWLMNIVPPDDVYALLTLGSGVSTTGTSAIAPQGTGGFPFLPSRGCGGTPPTSAGYNAVGDATCVLTGEGDRPSDPPQSTESPVGGLDYLLTASSPLVDAVPLGVHGCGSEPWGDWYQQPQPADGNGDGVLACDIGPKELQPNGTGAQTPAGRSSPTDGNAWRLRSP